MEEEEVVETERRESSDGPETWPYIKFRYIIHGVPRNKQYTIEEARWCDQRLQFSFERIHTVPFTVVRQWLGYIPSAVGDLRTTLWMCFPVTLRSVAQGHSPLDLWLQEGSRAFRSLEPYRRFPLGTCQEQASSVQN